MAAQPLDANLELLLRGRHIASVGTLNADGSIHLTAVWYLYEDGALFVATSTHTRKYRNLVERPQASLMVDTRRPGTERGITVAGKAELISGAKSGEINHRVHSRYLSAAALADPGVGPVFAGFDDLTVRIALDSWFTWDMASIDAQYFNKKLATPGYMLATG